MKQRARRVIVELWKREILRFVRQRSRWVGALATPLLFWWLIGGGLGSSFRDAGSGAGNYFEFFYPGAIVLSVLFTAIFSTMSVIEDRHAGFLQGVLVAPIPRSYFVWAKMLGGATLSLIQGGLLLAFAPWVGVALTIPKLLLALSVIFVIGGALTALGFVFAWKIDSVQGYHGVMNLVLVPMWILSGAVFPNSGAARVFVWLQTVNPLSYGVTALRNALWSTQWLAVLTSTAAVALFGVALSLLSIVLVKRARTL